ncbi:hypothetical protein F5Y11DRAFT_314485 [Daldinia sp. FL1419]|nr:hypothetical protein F5Y11DRAFT_314485 [Daldinia sp. FL1419]
MEDSNKQTDANISLKVETRSDNDAIVSRDEPTSDAVGTMPNNPERQLEESIQNNDSDGVEKLLNLREDLLEIRLPYETKKNGAKILKITPLILAAASNATSIVRLLLERGANVNAADPRYGETALHLAAQMGAKDSIDLLLSQQVQKVDVNKKGIVGESPLHVACRYGRLGIVATLLDAHADLSQRDEHFGYTPFMTASWRDKTEVMKLLLDRGPKKQIDEVDEASDTPLHVACLNNSYNAASLLINLGAEIDPVGQYGRTPLHSASNKGFPSLINLLLDRGADIHKRDKNGSTPILLTCTFTHVESFKALVRRGASAFGVSDGGNTAFHLVVRGLSEFSDAHRNMFKALVDEGLNIDQTNDKGQSPLSMAYDQQKYKHLECLVHLGADINQKVSVDGSTVLMKACAKPNTQIVEMLLRLGPDIAATNTDGQTAIALACQHGQLANVRVLIRDSKMVTVRNGDGRTPLNIAVTSGNIDIALEILTAPVYFPRTVTQERVFNERATSIVYVQEIEGGLLKDFEKVKRREEEWLQKVLYWAIANGAAKLVQRCISHNPQLLRWEQDGTTLLHIAINDADKEVAQYLLQIIPEQSDRVEAIIRENNQGESPLTLSITRKYKSLEALFWDTIRQFGTTDRSFMETNPEKASRILEFAAQYETPGNEVVLNNLLRYWHPNLQVKNGRDFTTLHLAVYCSQIIVVWWLLSKGGYSDYVESALKLLPDQYENNSVESHIKGLLQHPPPILDQVANPNNDRITLPPILLDKDNPTLNIQGNIIDIYSKDDVISIPYTKSTIGDIVYREGPKSLMAEARKNLDLNTLKSKLRHTIANKGPHVAVFESDQRVIRGKEDTAIATGELKLRWIHLPVNDLQIMRDLVCRLSHDSGRLAMDHAGLIKHFNNSWTELAAGGKQHYMKPQCVKKGMYNTDHSNGDLGANRLSRENSIYTALYMPYLTLGTFPRVQSSRTAEEDKGKESSVDHDSKQIKHESMTLDQYYYPAITNTDERDDDQVLSKFLDEGDNPKKILLVNQLWIWIIDEKTIITATSENSKHTKRLFQCIQNNILYGEARSRFERATSVRSVMELFIGTATGFFMEKFIPCPSQDSTSKTKKGPIEIFRESLRKVADDEARLFRDFRESLLNESRLRALRSRDSQPNAKTQQVLQNRHHVIASETELLEIIRDICDELRMLRSLAEDQDVVWKQAFPLNGPSDHTDRFQYYHPCTPTDVKNNLDDMVSEANTTTSYINHLLDLRQAEYNRMQANDSVNQSKSIFIFTVVTIIFLPLSFLSSLFALDVSVFPHESGELKYQASWLFPILFCVTIVVSVPTIFLAWKVNVISERLHSLAEDPTERGATDSTNDTWIQKGTSMFSGGNLRRRWREHDKDVLPQHKDY